MRISLAALAAVAALALGLAGCGAGSGADDDGLRVLVTRDFGAQELVARLVTDAPGSAAALAASLGAPVGTRRDGWFLYVNGMQRDAGDDGDLHGGDRIWWDRRGAAARARVPAVVGSFPEPFAHGARGKRYPLVLECADDVERACDIVAERLGALGAIAARRTLGTGVGERTLRVVVGAWDDLRMDQTLELIDRGPRESGVYARFGDEGRLLQLLDASGKPVRALAAGAGLVAATRFEDGAPTWAITGTDAAGVEAAARALDEKSLRRRYALAVDGPRSIGLPTTR